MKKFLILALLASAILIFSSTLNAQNLFSVSAQGQTCATCDSIIPRNELTPVKIKPGTLKEYPEFDFWNFVNDSIKVSPKDSVNWKIVHFLPENGIKMSIVLTKPGKTPTSEPVRYWAYFQSDKKVAPNQKQPIKIFKVNSLVFSFSKIGTYKPIPLVTNNVVQRNVYIPENVNATKIELSF